MSAKKRNFEVDDKVFAKVRGFPAWPARIEAVLDAKGLKYNVFFYGTYETASVKRDELWPYNEETLEKFGKQKKPQKKFMEGLEEIKNNPYLRTREQIDEILAMQGGEEAAEDDSQADVNESAVSANDSLAPQDEPLEDSTPKGRKVAAAGGSASAKGKGVKRKAPADTPTTPVPPPKQQKTAAVSTPASNEPERTSRSGRVIKAKKFDDSNVDVKQDEVKGSKKKDSRKMRMTVKATGDIIEIDLDKDRPSRFDSKDSEIQWERATAKNAVLYKNKVESGEFVPEEVRRMIEQKTVRTPEEEEILKREKLLATRKEKIRLLKVEQRLLDLDLAIKQSLHFEHPDMTKCMEALSELLTLPVAPLMLKKQPEVVHTIRKLRKYVGPKASGKTEEDTWAEEAEKIRLKANQIYLRLQSAFAVADSTSFWDEFESQVAEYRQAIAGMDRNEALTLVKDPTHKK